MKKRKKGEETSCTKNQIVFQVSESSQLFLSKLPKRWECQKLGQGKTEPYSALKIQRSLHQDICLVNSTFASFSKEFLNENSLGDSPDLPPGSASWFWTSTDTILCFSGPPFQHPAIYLGPQLLTHLAVSIDHRSQKLPRAAAAVHADHA